MYSNSAWLTLILLFCHAENSNEFWKKRDSFEEKAIAAVSLVEKELNINDCIQSASAKAKQFYQTGDNHYAVLWISMYSRDCYINVGWCKDNRFPYRLNKELRCQHFSQTDSHIRSIFMNVSRIIDEALTIFSPKQYNQLFRGVAMDWPFADRNYFVEQGFFSCSTDINPALNFAGENILLIVKELTGVYIANYVQEKFAYQREVLGTTIKMFQIESKVTDELEINTVMSQFHVDRKRHPNNPKKILYIREVHSPSKKELDDVINEQKTLDEGTCSPGILYRLMSFVCRFLNYLYATYMLFIDKLTYYLFP